MRNQELRNSEKWIESKLREEIKKRDGVCWKWTSPGTDGVPDRLIFLPKGLFYMVETKTKGNSLSPIQKVIRRILGTLGFTVYVIDSEQELKDFLLKVDNDLASL